MVQWRLINCTVSWLWLVMRTVYWNTHSSCNGREFSGEYRDSTSTRIPRVTASDIGPRSDWRPAMARSFYQAERHPILVDVLIADLQGFRLAAELVESARTVQGDGRMLM